jgi:hypothetical protein
MEEVDGTGRFEIKDGGRSARTGRNGTKCASHDFDIARVWGVAGQENRIRMIAIRYLAIGPVDRRELGCRTSAKARAGLGERVELELRSRCEQECEHCFVNEVFLRSQKN